MQTFTGTEYLKIDIANHYGLDKQSWGTRIEWVNDQRNLMLMASKADNPIRYKKSVRALIDTYQGKPTGHLMGLDATASGIQIMACLIGCTTTAKAVNLVDTGKREDVYQYMANTMTELGVSNLTKSVVKKPVMTKIWSLGE